MKNFHNKLFELCDNFFFFIIKKIEEHIQFQKHESSFNFALKISLIYIDLCISIYSIYLFILSHYLVQITFYIQLIDIIIIFS